MRGRYDAKNLDYQRLSARVLFRLMNATGFEEHTVMSTNTDERPAAEDAADLDGVKNSPLADG